MEDAEILSAVHQTQKIKIRNTNNTNIDNNINENKNSNNTGNNTEHSSMHVSWAQDFSHRNDNNFNFLQYNIKGNLDSILMNTSKPNPMKVYDTKLVSEEK